MEEINRPPSPMQPVQPQPPAPMPAKKTLTLLIVVALIMIIALSVGTTFFLVTKNTNSSVITTPSPPPVSTAVANPSPTSIPNTVAWKTYTNSVAGFNLKYPDSVLLNDQNKNATQSVLFISVDKISSIPEDLPQRIGRTDALNEKDSLAKGEGENIVKIGSLNAQSAITLSQFEVCSVLFTRSLMFFPGDYRVIISLMGAKNAIINSMPAFFTVDRANCSSERVWNQDKINTFELTLAQKKGQGAGQEWYDTFDEIVKTITLTTPEITAVPTGTIPADWSTYKNDKYGFEISYPKPYRVLSDTDSLSGYPKGIVLLYTGGQAYDVVIEVWNTKTEYESNYSSRMADVTVVGNKGKFITLLNNTKAPDNEKIITSFKLLP